MTSSYTSNLGIEKPATGDQSGTWGDTTNTNMDIIDRAINGVGAITLSGTSHTLTTSDGSLTDGMYKVLVLGGSPSGTNTITISPNDQDKLYFVVNSSGQTATFTQGSGANVSVSNGDTKLIYADGAGSGAAVFDFTANLAMSSVNITGGSVTGITDLAVADGGTGASTFTDGGVLLGSGSGAITAMAVLGDGEMIVGDGTTDPVAESGATLRTSIGVGTGDSPQFTGINVGHATDTTVTRASAGDLNIEGNLVYRAGGTDVPVADGGTGASTLTANGVLYGNGTSAVAATAVGTDGHVLTSNGSGSAPTFQAAAGGGKVLQIVTAQTDTAVSSNSTSRTDTGVTVAITPSATSSKVLIVSNIHCSAGGGRAVGDIILMRGATDLINYSQQANADNAMGNFSFIYLDSPSTTSATTYKFQQARVDQSGLFVTSRDDSSGDAISTILAIEIGA
tara:strand:+ start:7999 stop:9354 length:1356 start_codon:yes stop_codon:yes gene_type:complete